MEFPPEPADEAPIRDGDALPPAVAPEDFTPGAQCQQYARCMRAAQCLGMLPQTGAAAPRLNGNQPEVHRKPEPCGWRATGRVALDDVPLGELFTAAEDPKQ